jgi:hypothetical protein
MDETDLKGLFSNLYSAPTEQDVEKIIEANPEIFKQENWFPLGENYSNFGVIENQQSNPIAALIEKVTNSIDATLMKRCFEEKIDPKSETAPKSMEEAVIKFFPDHKQWDLQSFRRQQSENIQILADGPPRNTSVIVYDNGEGQHPEDFEETFLSLLRGNKNEIHFVQGKYNMGGSGGIVFCGKKRYQLIVSKRFDHSGNFGFTLIREHPLTKEEESTKKNTWYEYLKIDSQIPSFPIEEIELNLYGRKFTTGTIIKLYSYQFPSGYSGFTHDLNQSINEFLFEPALPVLTVDKKERYPNDKVLELDFFGLKRRLEKTDNEYVDEQFSEHFKNDLFQEMKVTCYVFKSKIKEYDVKQTKDVILRRFFKNNMSVLFSINGQVHGHYTSEFITRALKLSLLKSHLLIHVDCTKMKYSFRKELFMASRDRLKDGDETKALRKYLADKLGTASGRLTEIEKRRKDSIAVDSGDTQELLKSFTKNLPLNSELMKLLSQTFKLEQKQDKPKKNEDSKHVHKPVKEPFLPQRFPSRFRLNVKNDGELEVAKIPIGGEKTIKFSTDVEDQYFDRTEEPGDLKIALLSFKQNDTSGGDKPGDIKNIDDVFNIVKASPKEGTIKVILNPKRTCKVGDAVQLKVTLKGAGEDFEEIFWAKITDPEHPKQDSKKVEKEDDQNLGLPPFHLVYREEKEEFLTWDRFSEATTEIMEWQTVMCPIAKGDELESIYINMDSNVLKNFKSKYRNAGKEQLEFADRKYISSVYFHTLFLYTITKNRKYRIIQEGENREEPIEIGTYLKDLFESYYSEFILNFGGMDEMMQGLGE